VRWMALTNSSGTGLVFSCPDQMAASAVHFRPEDNYTNGSTRAKHPYQFKTCENTIVNLDAATRGIGNNSCGPDVLDKYELKAANTAFRFFIMPVTKDDEIGIAGKARVDMPIAQPVNCERQSDGRIVMTSATADAAIYYSMNGGEYKQYNGPIKHDDPCDITTYATVSSLGESVGASIVLSYYFDQFIDRTAWKLVSTDSQHSGNETTMAFDNDPNTFWHTEWSGSEPTHPHTLIVDMGKEYNIKAFTYLSRQDGSENGMVKDYEIYLSDDGQTWGAAVVSGQFVKTTSLQTATLKTPTTGRYFKFVAKSEINGNAWASIAEINIKIESTTFIDHVYAPISTDDNYYNLAGQKVPTPAQGIFINRGRKVVMPEQ